MKRLLQASCLAFLSMLLGACVSMPAPAYQASVDNSEALLGSGNSKISVGQFDAAKGVSNKSLSIRGSTLKGGSDGTYSTYLKEALTSELHTINRLDTAGGTVISATLTANELNAANIKTGKSVVGARFIVSREGVVIYDKPLIATHEWESSFIGGIAIPAAIDNYSVTIQKLLHKLFTDPDFVKALQSAT